MKAEINLPIINDDVATSCYFRTSTPAPYRKALIQITERCDLHCAHCFVSATKDGNDMRLDQIVDVMIPKLKQANVVKVTLTGGEPSVHPQFRQIVDEMVNAGLSTGICSNAASISQDDLDYFSNLKNVHFNISLDGFSVESHGRFRGDPSSFQKTIDNIREIANRGLLQGLLCTPNLLGSTDEYEKLCEFAESVSAKYVLMNPLSRMGRGNKSFAKLRNSNELMIEIEARLSERTWNLDLAKIRFPNESKPLAGCDAGTIFYVFTNGDIAVCPYLVFAARTEQSKHNPQEFLVANIFSDSNAIDLLLDYDFHSRYTIGDNDGCKACDLNNSCGKGCPAAVISDGKRIGEIDSALCPVVD